MKPARREYERILEFLIKNGTASKYAIAKGTAIPYPTLLRKLPEMAGAHLVQRIGEGKRGAELYVATPKGTLIAYFSGRVSTAELFLALPGVMKHVHLMMEELPAVKDPVGFLIGGLPLSLAPVEDLTPEDAVSMLGAILIWRHDEWYHELGDDELERLLSWAENYQLLRFLVSGSVETLRKMSDQAQSLSERAQAFVSRLDELAHR